MMNILIREEINKDLVLYTKPPDCILVINLYFFSAFIANYYNLVARCEEPDEYTLIFNQTVFNIFIPEDFHIQ